MTHAYREGRREGIRNPEGWQEVCERRVQAIQQWCQAAVTEVKLHLALKAREYQEHLGLRSLSDGRDTRMLWPRFLGWLFLVLCASLVLGSAVLVWLGLRPYNLGISTILLAAGTAAGAAALVEIFLKCVAEGHWIIVSLATIGLALIFTAHFGLGLIRADLFVRAIESNRGASLHVSRGPAAAACQPKPEPRRTLEQTTARLRWILPAFSVGTEVAAGLLLHLGLAVLLHPVRVRKRQQQRLEHELATLTRRKEEFEKMPACYRNDFEAGALYGSQHRDEIIQKRIAVTILVVFTLILLGAFLATNTHAEERVLLVDLSGSVASKDQEGVSEYQRNVEAADEITYLTDPGMHMVIAAITDDSFGNASVLLDATVSDDPGYFNENLEEARAQLSGMWRERLAGLRPDFPGTDVFGALDLAAQVFNEGKDPDKRLIILSDMRHTTPPFDFETPAGLDVPRLLLDVREKRRPVRLEGVKVHVLGVTTLGKSAGYWRDLQCFWTNYLKEAGAEVVQFSMKRTLDLPAPRSGL